MSSLQEAMFGKEADIGIKVATIIWSWIKGRWLSRESIRLRIYCHAMRKVLGVRFWNMWHRWRIYRFFSDSEVQDVIQDDTYPVVLKWRRISEKLKAYRLVKSEPSYFGFWRSVWVKMLNTDGFREEGLKISVDASGSTEEARAYCQRIVQQAQKLSDRQEQARVLSDLGDLDHIDEKYDEATKHYREALRVAEDIGDSQRAIQLRTKLGYLAIDQGKAAIGQRNFEEAERWFREALDIAERIDNADLLREVLTCLGYLRDDQGEAAREQGKYDEAEQLYQEALGIADKVGDTALHNQVQAHVGYLRDAQGEAAQKQGEYEQAEQLYQEGLKIAKDLGDVSLQTQTFAHLGLAYAVKRCREEARQHLIQAIDLWERHEGVPTAMRLTDEVMRVDEILGAETKWHLGLQRKKLWTSRKSEAAKKDAVQLLTEAAEIFERIGDSRAQQVRAELELLLGELKHARISST